MKTIQKLASYLNRQYSVVEVVSDSVLDLIDSDCAINVHAGTMGESNYDKMESHIHNYKLIGDGYIIRAFNDISGYDYWAKEGEDDYRDSNYIMIYIEITDLRLIDPDKLESDIIEAYNEFSPYDNWNEAYSLYGMNEF
jgi:hypothetical protein